MGSSGRKPRCDWDEITGDTLRDDEALEALYTDACCLRAWPNRDQGVIEFWAWAEASLSGILKGAPPTVFKLALYRYRWIARRIGFMKNSAAARMPAAKRAALVESVKRVAQVESVDADRRKAAAEEARKADAARERAVDPLAMDWDEVKGYLRGLERRYEESQAALLRARARVNVNEITACDLADDRAFAALFIELTRRGIVAPTDDGVLRCLMAADIALRIDKLGTPGAMFRHMIKAETTEQYYTCEAQDAAQRRMHSGQRAMLADAALNASPVAIDPAKQPVPAKRLELTEQRIGFVPSILLQVFLPQRRLLDTVSHYTTTHGRAWLAVNAGIGADEHGQSKLLDVPFGVYARLALIYLCTHAKIGSTVTIGHVREFLKAIQVPYGGSTALKVGAQVANLGACGFTLGFTLENDSGPDAEVLAGLESMKLASGVRYAEPWKGRQVKPPRPPWITELDLDPRFRAQVMERRAPVRLDQLAKLRKRPRAMDLCLWLGYRVRDVGAEAAEVPISDLRHIFAPGMPARKWPAALQSDLAAIRKIHRFRVKIVRDLLVLRQSKLPVKRIV